MSIEQARKYVERVISDEDLRKRLLAAKSVEEKMAIINAEGFDCTIEEVREVSQQYQDNEVYMKGYEPVYGVQCQTDNDNK